MCKPNINIKFHFIHQVRPQLPLPQLTTCLVQMNNQTFEKNYVDMPIESFNNSNAEPKIKQEIMSIPNMIPGSSRQMNSQLGLSRTNDTIEYISNDLDDDNIQGN